MKRFVFLLSVLLILGCSDEVVNHKRSVIWPLAIGNQWTLETCEFNYAGDTLSFDTLTLEVVRDTVINSERWFIIYVNGSYDPELPPVTNKADGGWQVDSLGQEWMSAKYPAVVNDSFQWGDQMCYVDSINEIVTVPAGDFTCYRYRRTDIGSTDPRSLMYLSPDRGLVKLEELVIDGGGQPYVNSRSELLSFVLH